MMKLLGKILQQKDDQRQSNMYRDMLRFEGRLGGELFGPIPEGHTREFFCLDKRTWVWHEEWKDENGRQQARITRYDVSSTGVLKSQGGQSYQRLSDSEARNLYKAASLYVKKVGSELNKIAQSA